MSIVNSQAILKSFIDLKSSVWFTLGSEEEPCFVRYSLIFWGLFGKINQDYFSIKEEGFGTIKRCVEGNIRSI